MLLLPVHLSFCPPVQLCFNPLFVFISISYPLICLFSSLSSHLLSRCAVILLKYLSVPLSGVYSITCVEVQHQQLSSSAGLPPVLHTTVWWWICRSSGWVTSWMLKLTTAAIISHCPPVTGSFGHTAWWQSTWWLLWLWHQRVWNINLQWTTQDIWHCLSITQLIILIA